MLTLCMLYNFACVMFIFFQNQHSSFRNINRVSKGLDRDQDQHLVGPDLGPNCLQGLSAVDKLPLARKS